MSSGMIHVAVPQMLYQRLERLAQLSGRSLESLVAQTLTASIPPIPDDLPIQSREALQSLEQSSDDELWSTLSQKASEISVDQWEQLRARERSGIISTQELTLLNQLRENADLLTLKKAYAAIILKWRGYRIPSLAEMEV